MNDNTMHYTFLKNLDGVLRNLQLDTAIIGFSVAGLMLIFYAILILFDQDTSATGLHKRWEGLRKVILVVAVIAGAAGLIGFSRELGGALLPN